MSFNPKKLSKADWYFYTEFLTSFRMFVPIFMQIGQRELFSWLFENNLQISLGVRFMGSSLPKKNDDDISPTKVSESTNFFPGN